MNAAKVVSEPSDHQFTAALGAAVSGRLIIAASAGAVRIQAGRDRRELCRARFRGCLPAVRAEDGVVTIRYRSLPVVDWLGHRQAPRAAIRLNSSIPWEIELRGSMSRLVADLAGLDLRSLDLNSDTGRARIWLPQPVGTVYVQAGGSVRDLVLRRPEGVALRIRVSGRSSRLACDGKLLVPTAGSLQWQTPEYAATTGRYDIRISGQAGKLAITAWPDGETHREEVKHEI